MCLEPGCPIRIEDGSYCRAHALLRGGEGPGGFKPTYSSREWKRARKQARERDGNRCVRCGSTRFLQVHHLNGNASDMRLENLITLCRTHHRLAHRV